jgi:hypothetical protein
MLQFVNLACNFTSEIKSLNMSTSCLSGVQTLKKDTWIQANSFKSTFRISREKNTTLNSISNSFDNFILTLFTSTKGLYSDHV